MEMQAWYRDEASAAEAVKALRRSQLVRVDVGFREIRDEKADPVDEELEGSEIVAGPAVVMSTRQAAGGAVGTVAGILVLGGAALVVGLILLATGVIGTLVFVMLVVGFAVAGATAGVIIGGREAGERMFTQQEQAHQRWVIVHAAFNDERGSGHAKEIFQRTRADRIA